MKRLIPIAIIITLLLCSCSGADVPESTQITDRNGKTINVPASIERVICMSPASTDILVDIGMGDKLVAVDNYSVGKSGVSAELPAFDSMQPDAERIAELEPDIVVTSGMSAAGGENPLKTLEDMGICLIDLPMASSLEDIRNDILFLGQVTGKRSEAAGLINNMNAEIQEIQEMFENTSFTPSVYFEITSYGPYSCGSGTFIDELITTVGGRNIFSGVEGWLLVAEEEVIAANPDMVFTCADDGFDPVEAITTRNGWDAIEAVANGRVYAVDPNASAQPNHKVVTALRQMAEARAAS